MTHKYIIDKEDLPMLIKGEALTLDNGNAFNVEVNGTLTNGDVIKAIVGNNEMTPICIGNGFCAECKYYSDETDKCNVSDWWNSPYKEGDKE